MLTRDFIIHLSFIPLLSFDCFNLHLVACLDFTYCSCCLSASNRRFFFFKYFDLILIFSSSDSLEEMEMKIESANTSPVNNSTSTIDTQGDGQKVIQRATSRIQSSQTMLTDVVN